MKKKSLTAEAVLDGAANILREKGIESCTMRVLAKELNIAVGTLYNYYASREEMLRDLFDMSWNRTIEGISRLSHSYEGSVKNAVTEALILMENDISDRNGLGSVVITSRSGFARVREKIIEVLASLIETHSLLNSKEALLRSKWILAVISDNLAFEREGIDVRQGEFLDCLFD